MDEILQKGFYLIQQTVSLDEAIQASGTWSDALGIKAVELGEELEEFYVLLQEDQAGPFSCLKERFGLSLSGCFFVCLAAYYSYDARLSCFLEKNRENAFCHYLTLQYAAYLYDLLTGCSRESAVRLFLGENRRFSLLFSPVRGELLKGVGTRRPLLLQDAVFLFLTKGHINPEGLHRCGQLKVCPEIQAVYPSETAEMETFLKQQEPVDPENWEVLSVYGAEHCGKEELLYTAGHQTGCHLLIQKEEALASDPDAFWLCMLNAVLSDARVVIVRSEKTQSVLPAFRFMEMLQTARQFLIPLILLGTETALPVLLPLCKVKEIAIGHFGLEKRILLWEKVLSGYPELSGDAKYFGSRYMLQPSEVLHLAEHISGHLKGKPISEEEFSDVILSYQSDGLSAFGERMRLGFTRKDLIVSKETGAMLDLLCACVNNRYQVEQEWGFGRLLPYGRGVSALFTGPPGTGKTMAAQVIAKELGLVLYRIDLSKMVSKYIGETEKNISELFEKAKDIQAVLFFDEADSMFSKRTEVSDAQDRHANGEVAHLLQKLEEYEGVAILATNLKENLDDAFKRRIQFIIPFALPDEATRYRLWKSMLPEKLPGREQIDIGFLSKHFELSGSEIKNVLVLAAYMATMENAVLGNQHIAKAMIQNFEKYGRLIHESEFAGLLYS